MVQYKKGMFLSFLFTFFSMDTQEDTLNTLRSLDLLENFMSVGRKGQNGAGCNVRWYSSDLSRRKIEILFFFFFTFSKKLLGFWCVEGK